ncbi:MAG TPA: GNAT family N-acetyltransferase [Caulobacteraceae bacterium]|jgi:RimJ/RimL family protein N-acetyltransferase
MQAPTLQTERLILRAPTREDFDAYAESCADPEVMRHLGGVQPRSVAWRGFTGMAGSWALQGFGMFSVIERSSGRWIGRIGPHRPEGWPGNEVGWGLAREAWGKGYACEAAAASMDFAVDRLGWSEIIHCIDSGNIASQKVAQRLGSSLTGVGRMPPPNEADIDIWSQTAAQWRERRRS